MAQARFCGNFFGPASKNHSPVVLRKGGREFWTPLFATTLFATQPSLPQLGNDRVGDLGSRGLAAPVNGLDLALLQDALDGMQNPRRLVRLSDAFQEIDGRQQKRQRIG